MNKNSSDALKAILTRVQEVKKQYDNDHLGTFAEFAAYHGVSTNTLTALFAIDTVDELREYTEHGNPIVRANNTYAGFLADAKAHNMTRLYDNGYTAAYYDDESLITYCEGDTALIVEGDNLQADINAHLAFYNENEA